MFLSSVMNKSAQWTVLHEPPVSRDRVSAAEVQERFNRDWYGEVNSYLRWCFADVDVDKRGIIIRNPTMILASASNRRPPTLEAQRLSVDRIVDNLHILVRHIARHDVRLIRFEKMTTDVNYLKGVLRDFGITDHEPMQENMTTRVNQNARPSVYEELPREIRDSFVERAEFFLKEYYPNEVDVSR